jgi:hypothetical protein
MDIKKLKKIFLGKICTIFTSPTNRDYKSENPKTYPKPLYTYFVGLIEDIDDWGIYTAQATTGLPSFFLWTNVVGIAQEELLDPENEKDAEVIENIKSEYKEKIKTIPALKDGQYVDIENLDNISKGLSSGLQ